MRSLALGTICLLGCSGPDVVVGDLQEVMLLPAVPNRDLDILFVIDNSPSMLDKQTSLKASFPLMMDVLSTLDAGLPNLHIGVVTSDMGTSDSRGMVGPGIGSGPGSCSNWGGNGYLVQAASVTDRYISNVDIGGGVRSTNYTGTLRDAFTELASVGAAGCGFEQHLSAMRAALRDETSTNAGFLRDSANLAVVILADEDDCSAANNTLFSQDYSVLGPLQSFRCFEYGVQCSPDAPRTTGSKSGCTPRLSSPYVEPVGPFADFLLGLKPDPRMIMVSAIAGDPSPVAVELRTPPGGGTAIPSLAHSCTWTGTVADEVADPAVRFQTLLDRFPGRSRMTSVCGLDLSSSLTDIGISAKQLMGDPCLDATNLADSSDAAGLQPACLVYDVRDSAPDQQRILPLCDNGAGDCYELVPDTAGCPTSPDHLRLRLYRTGVVTADTWTHVRCETR